MQQAQQTANPFVGGANYAVSMPAQMSPTDKKALMERQQKLQELTETSMARQQIAVDDQVRGLEEYKAKDPGMNWAPMAAYIDFLNKGKSNMASQYRMSGLAPESEAKRAQTIAKMQQGVSKAQGALTDDEIANMKTQISNMQGGLSSSAQARLMGFQATQARHEQRFTQQLADKIKKNIDSKVYGKGFEENIDGLRNLQSNFQPDARTGKIDFQKFTASLSNFARIVSGEKGVLTEGDIKRVAPKSGAKDVAGLISWFKETPTEDLPAGFANRLNEMIDVARRNMVKNRMERLEREHQSFTDRPGFKGLMTEGKWGSNEFGRTREYLQTIDPNWSEKFPWEAGAEKQAPVTVDKKLQRLQELRQKAGK